MVARLLLKWMVASLQPSLEALLPIGIPWQDVQVELLRCDMTALTKGLQQPQALLDSLIRQTGPLAAKLAIQQAKPVLQTLVDKGVSWQDIEDSLKAVEIHDLVEGLKDPRRFIAEVERTAGPPARAWVLVKVKAAVAAVLPPDIAWEDLDGIENTVGEMSLEELREDLMQPNRLLMSLASKFYPLAVKIVLQRLWGSLEETSLVKEQARERAGKCDNWHCAVTVMFSACVFSGSPAEQYCCRVCLCFGFLFRRNHSACKG